MAIANLASEKYGQCTTALYAINALLPEEYRVKISNEEFEKYTKQYPIYACFRCKLESKHISVFERITPLIEGILFGRPHDEFWTCPRCFIDNRLSQTDITQEVLDKPYFIKVVPDPPNRKDGLMDRTNFHNKFIKWAETLLIELESQLSKFRSDNWTKGGDDFETDLGLEDNLEEASENNKD